MFQLSRPNIPPIPMSMTPAVMVTAMVTARNHGNWTGTNNYTNPDGYKPLHLGWPDEFEELILKNKVDLVLAGHVHHYERSWPVKNREDVVQS